MTTTEKAKITKIVSIIEDMDPADQVDLWNRFCAEADLYEDSIFYMEDFDNVMEGRSPSEIACCITCGDFSTSADYFCFDGYGNLRSFWQPWEDGSPVDWDCLAQTLVEKGEDMGSDEIREVLDEDEDGAAA